MGLFIVFVIVAVIIALLLMKKKRDDEETQVGPENDVGSIEPQPLEENPPEVIPEQPAAENVKIPAQEVPEGPVVADNTVAPIQDGSLEQPLAPTEDILDQVVPDPVTLEVTPVEEQISDEIPLASSEQTPLVEDLSTDNGPY